MDLSNFIIHSDDTSDLDIHCLLSRLIPIMTKLNHILIIDTRYVYDFKPHTGVLPLRWSSPFNKAILVIPL